MTVAEATTFASTAGAYVRERDDGSRSVTCVVEGVHCAGCVQRIEGALEPLDGVIRARVNAATRRMSLSWDPLKTELAPLLERVDQLGYRTVPCDATQAAASNRRYSRGLLQALAVAAFGAMNVMVISVAVWAGLAEDMGPSTRGFLHWIAAIVAVPTVVVAGYPFFRSAATAIRSRATNMDVPISLAVIVVTAASLFQTIRGADYVYFDAALALLFFLLIGRYLDTSLRGKALAASQSLLALRGKTAHVICADGTIRETDIDLINVGDRLHVAPGERFQVDGRIVEGRTSVDASLITGEAMPQSAGTGDLVYAGSANLDAAVVVATAAVGQDTLLTEISLLMDNAEQHRGRYVSLADRMARLYTPLVLILSLAGFILWFGILGTGWHDAMMIAVAVMIVTCPCALGLAVPAVQVGAVERLFRQGVLVKSGDALERLDAVDIFVFDKTGTLTLGRPALANLDEISGTVLARAAAMAANSHHPLARALCAAADGPIPAPNTREHPGDGISSHDAAGEHRLGRAEFAGVTAADDRPSDGPELWYSGPGVAPQAFRFHDTLKRDAADSIAHLSDKGCGIELLSGDRENVVADIARQAAIDRWRATCDPSQKVERLEVLRTSGQSVAMVGDGLNDAPALAAAHVSLSPSTAADISQNAADIVFQGDLLSPVVEAHAVARKTMKLVRQNIALAIAYNIIAIPVALSGTLTPFIAAILMSASSIVVTLNALRVRSGRRP